MEIYLPQILFGFMGRIVTGFAIARGATDAVFRWALNVETGMLLLFVVYGLVGALLARTKGLEMQLVGLVAGAALGPLGWAFALFGRGQERNQCPHCGGTVETGFRVCKHCGRDVQPPRRPGEPVDLNNTQWPDR